MTVTQTHTQRLNVLKLNMGNLERPPLYPDKKTGKLAESVILGMIRNNSAHILCFQEADGIMNQLVRGNLMGAGYTGISKRNWMLRERRYHGLTSNSRTGSCRLSEIHCAQSLHIHLQERDEIPLSRSPVPHRLHHRQCNFRGEPVPQEAVGLEPYVSILSVATKDFRNAVNMCQTDPTNMLMITAETSASLRSMIEAPLNCKTEKEIETDSFHGILDCIVTHAFHWPKTKEMKHAKKAYFKDLSRDPDNRNREDPQDIEHQHYTVTPAERYKLMTNKMLMLGENDADWHHPLLVNISCNSWPPNITQGS